MNSTPEAIRIASENDWHTPDKFRVIGPLRNMPEFARAFNIRPGSRMALPPSQRVRFWSGKRRTQITEIATFALARKAAKGKPVTEQDYAREVNRVFRRIAAAARREDAKKVRQRR
jgi:Peptidase family M13